MRVEWAKARACMKQWKEELLIVQEEMRQVIKYLWWKATWWQVQTPWQDHYNTVEVLIMHNAGKGQFLMHY